MKNSKYFRPETFVESVLAAMKIEEAKPEQRQRLADLIQDLLAKRIIITLIDKFGEKEMEKYEKLADDHPELNEFDILILMAPEIEGLKEDLEKEINSLYQEMVSDCAQVDAILNANTNGNR